MENEMKTCSQCNVAKPVSEFYVDKRRNKPKSECKQCANNRTKKHYAENKDYYASHAKNWRAENRERSNGNSYRHKAKKRQEIYSAWLEHQDGKCAVCKRPQDSWEDMHLDHDHRTGTGRGLCCRTCNYLLGMVDDDREILLNAVAYLDSHRPDLTLPKKFRKWRWWSHLPPR